MTNAYKATTSTRFLIDGFPRSHENLDAWDATMKAHTVRFVLNFECPEEVLYVYTHRLFTTKRDETKCFDALDWIGLDWISAFCFGFGGLAE